MCVCVCVCVCVCAMVPVFYFSNVQYKSYNCYIQPQ